MAKRCVGCMKTKNNSPICEHCGYNENIPNYPHQLPIGTVLREQYVVGKVLGQDDYSITYIGWEKNLDSPIVIKEYYPQLLASRDCSVALSVSYHEESCTAYREKFLQEARELAKLRDIPGIVHVHNIAQEHNTAYIILEHVEGISLWNYLRTQKRPLTIAEVLHVMLSVIKTVEQIHARSLVHQDISPHSILIQPNGIPKLLDFVTNSFFFWKEYNIMDGRPIRRDPCRPMEMYASKFGAPGPWTDIYALCATMYYCLTSKVPSEAPERVMGYGNIDWTQVPGLSRQQIAALEKGMAVNPKDRTDSLDELELALYSGFTSYQEKEASTSQTNHTNHTNHTKQSSHTNPGKSDDAFEPDYPRYTIPLDEKEPIPDFDTYKKPKPEGSSTYRKKPTFPPIRKKKLLPLLIPVVILVLFLTLGDKQGRTYEKAMDFMDSGDYGQAAELFRELEDYEDAAAQYQKARYKLAEELADQGSTSEALRICEELLDLNYRTSDVQFLKGKTLLKQGEYYQQALDLFEDLAEESYSGAEDMVSQTRYEWANALIQQDQKLEALEMFGWIYDYKDVEERAGELAEELYTQAQEYYRAGRYQKAQDYFSKLYTHIDTTYYLRLTNIYLDIEENGYDSANELFTDPQFSFYLDDFRDKFYVENTADAMLSCTNMACAFLLGEWRTGNNSHYFKMERRENNGSYTFHTSFNLPWYEGDYFTIKDGVYYTINNDTEIVQYKMKLTAPDTLEVYAAKDGKTYILTRKR